MPLGALLYDRRLAGRSVEAACSLCAGTGVGVVNPLMAFTPAGVNGDREVREEAVARARRVGGAGEAEREIREFFDLKRLSATRNRFSRLIMRAIFFLLGEQRRGNVFLGGVKGKGVVVSYDFLCE